METGSIWRICDAAITNLPLCQSPDDVEATYQNQREQERHERELASIDRDRLWMLSVLGSYACRMVAPREKREKKREDEVRPMLSKLQVANQRALDPNEVRRVAFPEPFHAVAGLRGLREPHVRACAEHLRQRDALPLHPGAALA